MKKIIFYLSIILFLNKSYSQHIAISKIDKFTKKEVLHVNASKDTNWKDSDNIVKGLFNKMYLSLQKNDTIKCMSIDLTEGSLICIFNDSKIIILLENDNTIELSQLGRLDCSDRVVAKYSLDDENIEDLINHSFKKFRIYTTEGFIDFEIKEDKIELIKNTFALFKNKL